VIEIESEESEANKAKTLVEASSEELRRKQQAGRSPVAVIDDDNLEDFARRGELTFAEGEVTDSLPEPTFSNTQEGFWREQALKLRLGWSESVAERQSLEDQAALLRRRFYSEDDPFVRDGKIKPDWDRVLDRISETKQEEERFRRELDDLYERAGQAGADLSWLEEGLEIEPSSPAKGEAAVGELPVHEVKDPPVGGEGQE